MQSDKPFSQQFLFSRLPGVSHKFCDISLWATAFSEASIFEGSLKE